MSTSRYIDRICIIVIIAALIVTVLFMNGEALGLTAIVDGDAEDYEGSAYFTANDRNGTWDTTDATVITLNGDSIDISGTGAYVYGDDVVIGNAGWYLVSGSLTDGSLIVDAYSSSKVFIMLDSVDINCSDSAAIRVEQAEKVFLSLADGSVNTVTSGEEYSDDAVSDGISGAIFARDDLTINGSGSLYVNGAYKHGIVAKDDLVITGGDITVDAAVDAIRANDSLRIMDASISVSADDDGVIINKDDGYMYIESGTLDIDCSDDGIHSAGDITVAGGAITINAEDDGIHSDTAFVIDDGTILIEQCYEGIEAVTIDINGGDVTIYPTDDGLNANGGSSAAWGMGGGMQMRDNMSGQADVSDNANDISKDVAFSGVDDADADETHVRITGGTLTIINDSGQDADGIDSNGDLIITGGTVRVSLVNNGNNSALDYGSESGGVAEISGGTVIACGNYSMAEQFDSSSSQASILYTYSAGAEAGTIIAVEDTDGNTLISYEVPQSFSSMNISFPELTVGENYIVVIGDSVEEITIDEVSASYGDAVSGGFGGNMNFGGMQSRGAGGFGGGRGRGGVGRGGVDQEQSSDSDSADEDVDSEYDGEIPMMPDASEYDGEIPMMPNASEYDGEIPMMPNASEFDGDMPDMDEFDGERPDMGEFDGDMPDMDEFDGERPDMGEFDGDMPDMGEFDGERPDMNEAGGGMRPEDIDMANSDEDGDDDEVEKTGTALSELGSDVWIPVAASIVVLIAGLIFVTTYRRRR